MRHSRCRTARLPTVAQEYVEPIETLAGLTRQRDANRNLAIMFRGKPPRRFFAALISGTLLSFVAICGDRCRRRGRPRDERLDAAGRDRRHHRRAVALDLVKEGMRDRGGRLNSLRYDD